MTDSDANTSHSLIQDEKSRSPLQFCKWLIGFYLEHMPRQPRRNTA